MSKKDDLFENYIKEIDINPSDYDSDVEASLVFPIEIRLLEETDQKWKVTFDENGRRVNYEKRLENGRIGPTNTVKYAWKQHYNNLLQESDIDEEQKLVKNVTEVILGDMRDE